MGIRVKDTATIAAKFKARAAAAQGDYQNGVKDAGAEWQAKTAVAGDAYAQGVTAAIGRKAFERGVSDGGAARYQKRATELGPARYQQGVNSAQDDYARGVGPYLDRLKSLDLPPRGPRRSPANMNRANAVAMALAAMKEGK